MNDQINLSQFDPLVVIESNDHKDLIQDTGAGARQHLLLSRPFADHRATNLSHGILDSIFRICNGPMLSYCLQPPVERKWRAALDASAH